MSLDDSFARFMQMREGTVRHLTAMDMGLLKPGCVEYTRVLLRTVDPSDNTVRFSSLAI